MGDIHQPMHAYGDRQGANGVPVTMTARGLAAKLPSVRSNLHAAWDEGLLHQMTWSWGALVTRVEDGWMKTEEAQASGLDLGTPRSWAEETHAVAQRVSQIQPADGVLDDKYLTQAMPMLDRQLGVAALRLARVLNDAFMSSECPRP